MFNVKQKMMIARCLNRLVVLPRRLLGLGPDTVARRSGVTWALDLNEGLDLSIYLLGSYEPRMLRAYTPLVKPGDTVFDIGANIGAHTLHFARLVGAAGQVHAFEPTDFAFGKLQANLALNPALQGIVRANQVFLVAEPTTAKPESVYSSWPVSGQDSAVHEKHLGKAMSLDQARSLTVDEYGSSHTIGRLDLVKIDVDGHEFTVLQGFRESLRRFRPKILIELAPFVFDEVSPEAFGEVVGFLAGLGYDFFDAYSGKAVPSDAAGLRALMPEGGSMNALLLPRNDMGS